MSHNVASGQKALHVWRIWRGQMFQWHRHPGFGHHDMDQATSLRDV